MGQPEDLLTVEVTDTVVVATGEIDAYTSPQLVAAIDAAAPTVRLDLSRIEFVDSSGLRVLVDAHQRLGAEGGSLTLVATSAPVRRVLELSGLDEFLAVGS